MTPLSPVSPDMRTGPKPRARTKRLREALLLSCLVALTVLAAPVSTLAQASAPASETLPVDADMIAAAEEAGLQILDAREVTLDDLQWVSRPVVVFADTPRDPRFGEQLSLLLARPAPLVARDVVVIFDATPADRSAVRQALRPRGFSTVILQRDGQVALRKPNPWDVREITRTIDNLPMRIEEMGRTQ